MTDTASTPTTAPSRPVSGRRTLTSRIARSIGYDVALVPVSLWTIGNAVARRAGAVHQAWRRLARFQQTTDPIPVRRPAALTAVVHGIISLVLGLLGWFLVMLLVLSILRGPFYGFVEHGPYGPGTWGGPTKAGAWVVHAAVSVPIIIGLPFVLRGLGLLQAAATRRMYGWVVPWWVPPATILTAVGGAFFFYAWTRQL